MEDVGWSSRQDDQITGEGAHENAAGDTEAGDTRMDPKLYRYATMPKSGCQEFIWAMRTKYFAGATCAIPICNIPDQIVSLVLSSENKVSTRGNTVLHLAANTGRVQLIQLVTLNFPGLLRKQNDDGQLPLHVAASAGHLSAVRCLVDTAQGNTFNEKDERGNTALHVAVENNHQDVAMFLVGKDGSTSHSTNNSSKTPLCMAAETANLELVKAMVANTPNSTADANAGNFWQGSNGNSILRSAIIWRKQAKGGLKKNHAVFVLVMLMYYHPISPFFLLAGVVCWMYFKRIVSQWWLPRTNRKKYTNLLETILSKMDSADLINSTDQEWMTPLTLAAYIGMTALDLAEKTEVDKEMLFRRKLTLMALNLANAPRSEERTADKAKLVIEDSVMKSLHNSDNLMFSKESVNTLLLVSTLVVGITFVQGFTIPGGYSSSGNDVGTPIFLTQSLFKIFLICNTMAMCGSITTSIALMWAQTHDPNIIYACMRFTLPVLGVTLTMMSSSFLAGVALIVYHVFWLRIFVYAMGFFFTVFIIGLLAPLMDVPVAYVPASLRDFLFLSFNLLMFVSGYNFDDDWSNRWSL
ncbi:protein ACCELERATED CELL DEATH 6-like isoform X2 [Pyrus communis]|uniref:protein ACCELERATED CELL DEATH 6-like isoform X2 n=1 Tax=Pyrus communis TaxID=23211 RepID=UPI0035C16C72